MRKRPDAGDIGSGLLRERLTSLLQFSRVEKIRTNHAFEDNCLAARKDQCDAPFSHGSARASRVQ